MHKVLMISHGYPPVGGSGMLRTLKFSRYLPGTGWQPCVITLSRTRHPRLDHSLLAEVPPETAIYRSPMFDLLGRLVRLRNFFNLRSFFKRSGEAPPVAAAQPSLESDSEAASRGITGVIFDLLSTPDQYAGWYLPGTLQGLWAILRHRPRAIYSTSPPPTAHLIASSLSRVTGLPWVADLRDPWTLQHTMTNENRRRLTWNRRLEKKLLRRARKIICNTGPLADTYMKAYPDISPEKFVVITNGFDPADFIAETATGRPSGPCCFTHAGEFMPKNNLRIPDPFLEALRELLREGKLSVDQVKVRLIGSGECEGMEGFQNLVQSSPLGEVVEITDFLSHDKIPEALASSDVLLLFQNAEKFRMQIPAKVFEYIRVARPILAIAPAGASAELVDSIVGGRTVHPDDREGMKEAILDLVASRGTPLKRDPEELNRFSRAELTVKLGKVLDEISGITRPNRPAAEVSIETAEKLTERS